MTNEAIRILKVAIENSKEHISFCFDLRGIEALQLAIKVLGQSSWIPVSESLPEESGDYLVTTKWKGSYSGDVYIETNMAVYRKKTKEWDCVDVIAWMPLPEPYKEDSNGE